ncbi:MAG: cysteine hydrolase [Sphingomonadaceae bacterium]
MNTKYLSTHLAAAALTLAAGLSLGSAFAATNPAYENPASPALPPSNFTWDLAHTAMVVIDPQVDFMSDKGAGWPIFGTSVTEQKLVPHLLQLFEASKKAGVTVAISPHYYYPHDHKWKFGGPAETAQHKLHMFDRAGALTLDGFRNSGADFMPEFKQYIENDHTVIAAPHKLYGPQSNDLMLQLRKQGINKIILTGMASNLCVESHLREFLERGFEVAVVRDAVAGPKLPDGDGYLSALVNFRYIASAVYSTDEVLKQLQKK